MRVAIPLPALAAMLALLAVPPVVALSASGGEDGVRASVVLADTSIEGPQRIAAGKVTFAIANAGRTEHELLILRTELAADDLPVGLEGPSLKRSGKLVLGKPHKHDHGTYGTAGRRGRPRHLQPGATERQTVTLAPGRYVLLCNLPGHYQAGQRAALTVE